MRNRDLEFVLVNSGMVQIGERAAIGVGVGRVELSLLGLISPGCGALS
jgi:hypothetical protein